ncbi:MAG: pyridoxal-phosphate dependent enzyme [Pseudomonadales bacterium]|nr:pyridoxal-phosphate dependent enzyme [Pseudomonadales bacterium]
MDDRFNRIDWHKTFPVHALTWPFPNPFHIEVGIARTDLLDDRISGNKWYKLKYNLKAALEQNAKGVASFGGAFSNHLHALAAAGNRLALPTVGFIRGELVEPFNPTLTDCSTWGMQLHPLTRKAYRERHDSAFQDRLMASFPGFVLLPEGGSNQLAVAGIADMVGVIESYQAAFDYIVLPVGSGGTLAGILRYYAGREDAPIIIGVSALKGVAGALEETVLGLVGAEGDFIDDLPMTHLLPEWWIEHDFHCGGFAKVSSELQELKTRFECQTAVPLDNVYNSKVILAVKHLLECGKIPDRARLLILHTGGLQGIRNRSRPLS